MKKKKFTHTWSPILWEAREMQMMLFPLLLETEEMDRPDLGQWKKLQLVANQNYLQANFWMSEMSEMSEMLRGF